MLFVVFVGLARSGKDTACDFFTQRFGFKKFVFSELLSEELHKRGGSVTKMNQSNLGNELRERFGMGVLGKMMWNKIKNENKIVLSGARSIEEVDELRKHEKNIKVVAIKVDLMTRFKRRRPIEPNDLDEFKKRDENDVKEKGEGKLIDCAEFEIDNNGSLDELQKQLMALAENWGLK